MDAPNIIIPVAWFLTSVGALCGTIVFLGRLIFNTLKERLDIQDKLIHGQDRTIHQLQMEIIRLSQGCGYEACHWRRTPSVPTVIANLLKPFDPETKES